MSKLNFNTSYSKYDKISNKMPIPKAKKSYKDDDPLPIVRGYYESFSDWKYLGLTRWNSFKCMNNKTDASIFKYVPINDKVKKILICPDEIQCNMGFAVADFLQIQGITVSPYYVMHCCKFYEFLDSINDLNENLNEDSNENLNEDSNDNPKDELSPFDERIGTPAATYWRKCKGVMGCSLKYIMMFIKRGINLPLEIDQIARYPIANTSTTDEIIKVFNQKKDTFDANAQLIMLEGKLQMKKIRVNSIKNILFEKQVNQIGRQLLQSGYLLVELRARKGDETSNIKIINECIGFEIINTPVWGMYGYSECIGRNHVVVHGYTSDAILSNGERGVFVFKHTRGTTWGYKGFGLISFKRFNLDVANIIFCKL
uniref:Uncharacterized protein n=1 Tax=Megaviridae environmental sample TaxID=1737588 RepID=A0A5J6VIF7_9VIRU|nr:MAG: hypothetical protein [Megaviridae environmental sample]